MFARGCTAAGALLLLLATASALRPAPPGFEPSVVEQMVSKNAARAAALRAYSGERWYRVSFSGLGHKHAAMHVRVDFAQPGPKRFTVLSESGSSMLRHHVLEPLLTVERHQALADAEQGSSLTPANYDFDLLARPHPGSSNYVLFANPHAGNPYLFRGTIWLDNEDLGLVKAVLAPVDVHSSWTTDTVCTYRGQNLQGFWLPASNHCVCKVRWFGHAALDIAYAHFTLHPAADPQ